ncbi:MAG: hypothetical protein MZU97_04710 [Bacillus subtilis]|nr:hypothetical protein [Bacillus subtilis]
MLDGDQRNRRLHLAVARRIVHRHRLDRQTPGVIDAVGDTAWPICPAAISSSSTRSSSSSPSRFSAFVDNIPYVATMLPVVGVLAVEPRRRTLCCSTLDLLIGATLGGNLTPIGASANITGIGILRKEGYEVKLWDYMKIGLPYSLSAVVVGYLLIWFIWS